MAFKIVLCFVFVAAASAQYHQEQNSHGANHGYQQKSQEVSYGGGHQEEEHYGPAKYDFSYEVHDEKHGDIKHQKESRDGDHVVGEYSLIEPDGHRRTVKYSSDKHTGFIAEVHREKVEGYQAPVYHQQVAYEHDNSHTIQKVVAAPVQQQYVSSGHQNSYTQNGYGQQASSNSQGQYSSHGQQHAQISQAIPVQKVIIAASSANQNKHLGLGHYATAGLSQGYNGQSQGKY